MYFHKNMFYTPNEKIMAQKLEFGEQTEAQIHWVNRTLDLRVPDNKN